MDVLVEQPAQKPEGQEPEDTGAGDLALAVTDAAGDPEESSGFSVHLEEFTGPFELLLKLISKHQLDVTMLALHQVTDEFIAHIRGMGDDWDLDETTEFLLVAATLLDLKAARLLPDGDVDDEDDLELLEARDLLFARLLQYRAYRQVADILAQRYAAASLRRPRTVGLDERFANLLPEVLINLSTDEFASLATEALRPKEPETVGLSHLHAPLVSVREQAAMLVHRLRQQGSATFAQLVHDSENRLTVVARFLALLELYREKAVSFEQADALAELTVQWVGSAEGDVSVTDEFDTEATADKEERILHEH